MNDNITNNVPGITEEPVHPWWDARTSLVSPRMRNLNHDSLNARIFSSPRSIYDYFDSRLCGCHEYKKAMATAIWSSIHLGTKNSLLVIGPSGCGKTELARILSEVYYNTAIFDASSASPRAYKGNCTISDALENIDTRKNALPGWVFIDEIDKALLGKYELGDMIQNELLKMTEGGTLYVGKDERDRRMIDTSGINFVFLGTFAQIKKDNPNKLGFSSEEKPGSRSGAVTRDLLLESKVLSNEFLGRINGGIIEVEPMDESKAAAILADERYSPVKKLENIYHINIDLSAQKKKELIGMTAKYGVRGMYSELQDKIKDAIFEDCTLQSVTL